MGMGYVRQNHEFITIKEFNRKPERYKYPLKYIEEFPFNPNKNLALSKPIGLYKKIFRFCKSNYVLDPFGGSFNSARGCYALNIAIDSVDKYLDPPNLKKHDISQYL